MNKLLVIIISATYSIQVNAQDFTIKKVELAGDKVNIYYDLIDSVSSRTYSIDLYSSKDNFVSRLEKVSGDHGLEVKPGGNHKLTWAAKEELGADFEGKVGLEVRGRLYIPFVRLEGLGKIFKRDRPYQITWTGGTQQNILNFDLYKGEEKVHQFPNIANVHQTEIIIPTSVKPGNDYHFKITDSKNKDQIVNTPTFSIKRKVPLLVKVAPFAIIGAIIATLPKPASSDGIPDPLDPNTIH